MIKRSQIYPDELGLATIETKIPVGETHLQFKELMPVSIEERSNKYAEMIKKGHKFPPIAVYGKRNPWDTYQVFDGHARVTAYRKLRRKEIDAIVTLVDENGRPVKFEELKKKA